MGLRNMFGWTNPKDTYGNALQQGIPNPNQYANTSSATNAAYSGYQNIANSATQAQQATIQQMSLNQKYQAYMQAQAIKDEPPRVNLNEGAWTVPISQLVDLWIVRFGSKWVDHEEIADDEFYQTACVRLEKMNKLETHHLQDRYMPVYRIVE